MRIGLDIDNVITNFDEEILNQFFIADKLKRGKGIVNPNASYISSGMFDWSKEEVEEFFKLNMEKIAKILKPLPECKFYIDRLLEDGHEIYLISHRVFPHYIKPFKTTANWLKKNKINYTKLIISKEPNKSYECKKYKIDLMIDDRLSAVEEMLSENISCWLMNTNFHKNRGKEIFVVNNWQEIYNNIKKINKENVILDTDISSEVDDQFALAYLIKKLDYVNLNAITLAPYCKWGEAKDTIINNQISFDSAMNILEILGAKKYNNIIYKGATNYFFNSTELNAASEKIISIARKNKTTTIVCIGAITNLAVALFHAPDIINKIKVVWLGGGSFLVKNREFNFMQDVKAVQYVFKHVKNLTVIPTKNVSEVLKTTTYELSHYLKSKIGLHLLNGVTEYIVNRSPNDLIGQSKTLWDISAVIYLIFPAWFSENLVSCPKIDKNGQYHKTKFKHKIKFVCSMDRNKIFKEIFETLG